MSTTEKKENRIFRFDFSEDDPKILPMPEEKKATKKKTISPELRQKINEGKKESKEHLTPREKRFCELYVELANGSQAVMQAGYNTANPTSASVQANVLLKLPKIKAEIQRLMQIHEDKSIADAQEVMQFFTDVMRGKIKDQFGLEASLAERAKAADALAKRTIDIENRLKATQNGDNVVTIKLDWQQS